MKIRDKQNSNFNMYIMRKRFAFLFVISMLTTVSLAQLPWEDNRTVIENNTAFYPETVSSHSPLKIQIVSFSILDTMVIGYVFTDAAPDKPFQLFPNVPNPFSTETTFWFYLPEENFVEISIYDLMGQLLEVLPTYLLDKGSHSLPYRNTKLSTGSYFYRVNIDGQVKTGKMMVVK